MKNLLQVILISTLLVSNLLVQAYSEQGLQNSDSLQNLKYLYILPIYGAKANKLGYKLPYSAGIGVNYLWQESDLVIDNLQIGFNNGLMTNPDEVIRFDGANSAASGVNIHPDISVSKHLWNIRAGENIYKNRCRNLAA